MQYRKLGKTGFEISEISIGTWQVGGKWGSKFDHKLAEKIIRSAIDSGVNFIDTADVYSEGESEKAVGKVLKDTTERIYVATKCGRQISPHMNEGYQVSVLRKYVEDSLQRLNVDCLDLIQLHCPPSEVYYRPEIFAEFDKLKKEGKILNLGVSVEKIEEAIKAIEFDNVTSIQIIYNMFRQRPHEQLFQLAKEKNVGLIIRVPLASGLLTGKFSTETKFEKEDHRNFNIDGRFFDKGETFAGIPYNIGIKAIERLKVLFPDQKNLAIIALNWILMREEVSCIIPGASNVEQVGLNVKASEQVKLTDASMIEVNNIYDELIKEHVHQKW